MKNSFSIFYAFIFTVSTQLANAATYSVQVLPGLGGVPGDFVVDLNDRGEAVGHSFAANSSYRPVMWTRDSVNDLSALGLSAITSINNQGVITARAGSSAVLVSGGVVSSLPLSTIGHQAVYYSPFLQHSGFGNEQTLFDPIGVDSLGRVAGNITTIGCNSSPGYCNGTTHSAVWENFDATVICCNQGTVRRSSVVDVSESGQVLVNKTYAGPYGFDTATFGLYSISEAGYRPLQGVLWSEATAINNLGDVVGSRYSVGYGYGFYAGTLYSNGAVEDLGAGFAPQDINDSRQIVGKLANRATIWADGTLTDLNTLVDLPEDLLLTDAVAINNQGVITGNATVRGVNRVYMLTPAPVPLPGTILLMLLPLFGLGFLGRNGIRPA